MTLIVFMEDQMKKFRSSVPGLVWPVIPEPEGALIMALQFQLEKSQWLSDLEIREQQLKQAEALIYHAAKYVPYYKDRIPALVQSRELTAEIWQSIPILTRHDLLEAKDRIKSQRPMPGHDRLNEIYSSGSTGVAIKAYGTQTTGLFWQAFTLREHIWHDRDLTGKLAAIRPVAGQLEPGEFQESDSWGGAVAALYKTGSAVLLSSRTDISDQVKWLKKENPVYLLSLPSNLRQLAKYCRDENVAIPNLKQVRTMGEVLTEETIDLCRSVWGVPVVDMYSAQEVGYMALQCKEFGSYHVQSEGVLLEVLDENNKPCKAGEIGKVVVTTLLNFAAPLIRYEIGDYAALGDVCACGRGLPVLKQIQGRQRNMMKTPDGRVFWPSFPSNDWEHPAISQLQVVQTDLGRLLIKIATTEGLSKEHRVSLQKYFSTRFGYDFSYDFEFVAMIPRSKGGKYEDFVSLLSL